MKNMWSPIYCRLCAEPTSEEEAVDIFQQSDATLRFIIQVRLQIRVTMNQHSNFVCSVCVDHLKNFHSFSKKCYSTQIQLAQISSEENGQTEDENCMAERKHELEEDEKFYENPLQKRPKVEITAENCDNIIIPDTWTTENSYDITMTEDVHEFPTYDESVNEDSKPSDLLSQKVPLSKLKKFFLSKIRQGESHSEDDNKNDLRPDSPFSGESTGDKNVLDDDEREQQENKWQKRRLIPPKVNEDDVQCPYCRWHIPYEEYNPDHLLFHVKDLNSEFHRLVMMNDNQSSLSESLEEPLVFRCEECNEHFSKKLSFLEHRNGHENRREIACHLCNRAFYSRNRLRAHLCSIHLEKTFACDQCSYRSKNKPDMAKHRFRVHTDARIQCPLCGKLIAAYPHNLTKHLETHNEVPEYACDLCPAAYKTKAGLHKHRENKHYPKPAMCSMCGVLCASKQKYSKHLTRCRRRFRKMEENVSVEDGVTD